jgi:coatomer subunit beta'
MDGKNNIAFTGFLILGEIDRCLDILCRTQRIPEAALLARTYAPSQVPRLVNQWKQSLFEQKKHKVAEMISDPFHNPEMFPDYKFALFAEEVFKKRHSKPTSALEYTEWKDSLEWKVLDGNNF